MAAQCSVTTRSLPGYQQWGFGGGRQDVGWPPCALAVIMALTCAVGLAVAPGRLPGDATAAGAAAFPIPVRCWFVLTAVDVRVPRPVNAVVTVGDPITDGRSAQEIIDGLQRFAGQPGARA
jgi:hypothetical protein